MIRVLIVDGLAARRERLRELLGSDPSITIVGETARAREAKEAAHRLKPSIIVIADRLPGAGGLDVTAEIMTETPAPVVIISEEHDPGNVAAAMNALRMGALTILAVPDAANATESRRFISTIKAMSQVRVVRRWREPAQTPPQRAAAPRPGGGQPSSEAEKRGTAAIRAVAIGASTGGPAAIHHVLSELPGDFSPSILIVQHIAKGFLDGLVQWLSTTSPLAVKIAEDGELAKPSTVYIAPDDRHLGLTSGARIHLHDGPAIGGFRPSATYLFESVAKALGPASIHVIMTGMGRDGVDGLAAARAAGADVIAQDEASSIIFGMPGMAVEAGVVTRITPLAEIGRELVHLTAR